MTTKTCSIDSYAWHGHRGPRSVKKCDESFRGKLFFEIFSDSCLLFIDTYFSSIKSYKSNFGSCDPTNCLSTCLMVKKGPKKGTTGMASSFAGRRQFDQSWARQFFSDKPSQSSSPIPPNRTNKCYLTFLPKIQIDLYSLNSCTTAKRSRIQL